MSSLWPSGYCRRGCIILPSLTVFHPRDPGSRRRTLPLRSQPWVWPIYPNLQWCIVIVLAKCRYCCTSLEKYISLCNACGQRSNYSQFLWTKSRTEQMPKRAQSTQSIIVDNFKSKKDPKPFSKVILTLSSLPVVRFTQFVMVLIIIVMIWRISGYKIFF